MHTRGAEEAFQRFHSDRETESQQENTIDERGEDLGSVPAVRVAGITCILTGELVWRRCEASWIPQVNDEP